MKRQTPNSLDNTTWTELAKYIQQGKQRSIEKEALPGASGNS